MKRKIRIALAGSSARQKARRYTFGFFAAKPQRRGRVLPVTERIKDFRIPVIAGIWPLTSFRNAEFMVNELRVPVPEPFMERMRRVDNAGPPLTLRLVTLPTSKF